MDAKAAELVMGVGRRLVELCNAGRGSRAVEELYADDCVQFESPPKADGSPCESGKAAILAHTAWWERAHQVHSSSAEGPFPHGDRFVCFMKADITSKEGTMAGQRMQLAEACLYTVNGEGKIARVEFFYAMGG